MKAEGFTVFQGGGSDKRHLHLTHHFKLSGLWLSLLLSFLFCLLPWPSSGQTPTKHDPKNIAAMVNGRVITSADVDKKIALRLQRLRERIYRLRKGMLDVLINEIVVEEEAAKHGLSPVEYRGKLFEGVKVSGKEISERYNPSNQPYVDPQAMERLRQRLENDRRRGIYRTRLEELKAEADIKIFLREPPAESLEVDIAGRPSLGKPEAAVTIVEYADFQCPHCKRTAPILKDILKHYNGDVRLVFKHMPFNARPYAFQAAQASLCAADQDKFWDYHNLLFENAEKLSPGKFRELAATINLDVASFTQCLSSDRHKQKIYNDLAEIRLLGFQAAPSFLINGHYYSGSKSFEEFKKIIDSAMENQKKGKAHETKN